MECNRIKIRNFRNIDLSIGRSMYFFNIFQSKTANFFAVFSLSFFLKAATASLAIPSTTVLTRVTRIVVRRCRYIIRFIVVTPTTTKPRRHKPARRSCISTTTTATVCRSCYVSATTATVRRRIGSIRRGQTWAIWARRYQA